jgi:hypothetical protein
MNYTVDWSDAAISALAAIWTRAADRSAVTAAGSTIDRLLSRDPIGNGHHVSEGLWWLFISPLLVHYEIDSTRRVVMISQVDANP